MKVQAAAALVAAAAAVLFFGLERGRAFFRRRQLVGAREPASGAHVIYFSTPGCSVCRTHQEPALRALSEVPVRKVDAVREAELAQRYRVYTVPSTVVLGEDGTVVDVNYGYASASRLRAQWEAARRA